MSGSLPKGNLESVPLHSVTEVGQFLTFGLRPRADSSTKQHFHRFSAFKAQAGKAGIQHHAV